MCDCEHAVKFRCCLIECPILTDVSLSTRIPRSVRNQSAKMDERNTRWELRSLSSAAAFSASTISFHLHHSEQLHLKTFQHAHIVKRSLSLDRLLASHEDCFTQSIMLCAVAFAYPENESQREIWRAWNGITSGTENPSCGESFPSFVFALAQTTKTSQLMFGRAIFNRSSENTFLNHCAIS